ncbi:MAG: error-prone DNA polymerase, partial [Dehalococcoidia bacterium]|nr:error-prone DNA polymerase [Dehalococcoidia bacterium]
MRPTDSFPHGDSGDWPGSLSNDHFCGPGEHGPRHKPARRQTFEAQRDTLEAQTDSDSPRSMAPRDVTDPVPIEVLDDAPYVELHLHSNYSLLEGASTIEELVWTASEQGYRALALSDHNGMYGSMEFARAAKEAGLRPITALELTITGTGTGTGTGTADATSNDERHHVTLLAQSREGYKNLCRLSSLAFGLQQISDEDKESHRLDPRLPIDELPDHAAGLILLTGCRDGLVPRLVEAHRTAEAEATLRRFVHWFGADNVFVELQDNLVFGDRPRNRALVQLAERVGVGVVGTGNVHYHDPARHRLQDVMVAIRHRKTLDESHRERRPNAEFYLRTPEQQARRFEAYHPDAAANSVRIARRCSFDLTEDLGYQLPSPTSSTGGAPEDELATICHRRLADRYATAPLADREAAEERLEKELRLIGKNGLAGFFLIYHQIFQLASQVADEVRGRSEARLLANMPPGRGRGSSVASIVCYLIGLSHIDPIKNNLPIDRFLNEEMRTFPDIDLDFARDIRRELIERVYQVWGKEHAALVAIFPTYRMRSAIRDVGKALGLPAAELDRLSKRASPHEGIDQLPEELARHPEFADRVDSRPWQDLIALAQELAGFPRHMSQHVGGMIISSEPLINFVPCQPAAWPNRYLCHWDKDSVDDARMVKIDFLALGMLSAVEETIDLIAEQGHRPVDLSRIDFDDPAVYDDICRGDTIGVFQIESRAQIAMLPRTQPRNLDDLTVQVSIVRPGPIVGGAVNPYVREREKQRSLGDQYRPPSVHSCVDDVLGETLGVVLFQEQVVQVARQMGGFTAAAAEQFRRAMSRKRSLDAMQRHEQNFMAGAAERGVPPATAQRMFQNLLGFAEFGFPKSHGAAFGLLAYQTTWLRKYHPAPMFCALFNNQPMGFYPPHVLTNDAKRHQIEVRRPDINRSNARCTVEPPETGHDAVRVGLGYVKGVGEAGSQRIEEERGLGGPFLSLFDFVQRTGLGREPIQSLIRIGAFDEFGLNRRELIWQLGLFWGGLQKSLSSGRLKTKPDRQLALPLATAQDQVALTDFSDYQRMTADYELLSLSPDQHPMQFLRPALGEGVASSLHLRAMKGGEHVEVAGLVVCRQRPMTAKGIIFLLLEDEFGLVNILVSKELSERFRDQIRTEPFVRARGTLEHRAGEQRTLVATQ